MAVGYTGRAPHVAAGWPGRLWDNKELIVIGLVFGLLVALLPPGISVALMGGVALGAVLLAHPELAVYLLVFAVPYESLKEITFGGLNATITEFIAFCGGVGFVVQGVMGGRVTLRWTWWRKPLLLFGLAMILSMTQATDLKGSIKEFLKLAEMLLAYLLVLAYIDTPAKLRRLILVIVLAVLSEAFIGLAQTFAHFGPASFARVGLLRGSGTFGQPNPFAGYLNLTLPLLLAAVVIGVPLVGRLTRPALVVIGAALLVAESRAALIAMLAAAAVMAAIYSRRARPVVLFATLVFALLVAATAVGIDIPGIGDKVAVVFGLDNVDVANPTPVTWSVAERLAHMISGLRMFADHPLLGVGIGNYPAAYPHYRVAPVWGPDLGQAHNYYINIAAEAGIVGLAAFLYVLVSAFAIVARLYDRTATPMARAIALGAIGVLVTVTVHSFFDDIFDHAMEVQVALVMGIATVCAGLAADWTARAPASTATAGGSRWHVRSA